MQNDSDQNKHGYSLTRGLRVYAVGDIHGYVNALDLMHDKISADLAENPSRRTEVIYLGDYIDRGPDSAGVLDRLVTESHKKDGIKRTFLTGNHEEIALRFLERGLLGGWFNLGGVKTLESYGLEVPDPEGNFSKEKERSLQNEFNVLAGKRGHTDFLRQLKLKAQRGGYLFVHAGVNPRRPINRQYPYNLLTIRDGFLDSSVDFGKRVVHGHSISIDGKPVEKPNRIGVDTGVYHFGTLSCAVLEGQSVRFLSVNVAPR
ncbi:MAG: metallophosphoesterase [Rhodospirillales bacterium]|nr:metallophosphoesterase [Rhodospirillales bacterium]